MASFKPSSISAVRGDPASMRLLPRTLQERIVHRERWCAYVWTCQRVRAQDAQRGRNRVARASRAISHARLAVALGAGVSLVWALAEGTDNPWAWLIAGILALIFGILVIRHAGVERDLARWRR